MQNNKYSYGFRETISSFFKTILSFQSLELYFEFQKSLFATFTEQFFEDFYMVSSKICELEAQTFHSEENKSRLNSLHLELNNFIHELNNCLLGVDYIIQKDDWRLIVGVFCCFMEWCTDVCYFNLTKEEQDFIRSENPLSTFKIFAN